MLPEKFYSTNGIEKDAKRHGSHWFDADSKRFFNSRVSSNVYPCANPYLTLFVSSERNNGMFGSSANKRYYTVRCYDYRTGDVMTIGEFQQYKSSKDAHNAAKRIAPTLLATIEELQEYAIALNENYDNRIRREKARGIRYNHPYDSMLEYDFS